MTSPRKSPRARKVLEKPRILGWKTSDQDEIDARRWRGRTEIADIEALEPAFPLFGTFRVQSASGGVYDVEIRDLEARNNSCGCIDHRVNGLGTCKHIEGVLAALFTLVNYELVVKDAKLSRAGKTCRDLSRRGHGGEPRQSPHEQIAAHAMVARWRAQSPSSAHRRLRWPLRKYSIGSVTPNC